MPLQMHRILTQALFYLEIQRSSHSETPLTAKVTEHFPL